MEISIAYWTERAGMPLVFTDGGEMCFLVDTGASYNVLLREAYKSHGRYFSAAGHRDYLIGMEGNPRRIVMVNGEISIGGRVFSDSFGVVDLSDTMDTLRALTGQRIDGALGISFLRKYKASVDFGMMRMVIP